MTHQFCALLQHQSRYFSSVPQGSRSTESCTLYTQLKKRESLVIRKKYIFNFKRRKQKDYLQETKKEYHQEVGERMGEGSGEPDKSKGK